MPWYCRVKGAINTAMPFLVPTQKTNLALLVSAILKKQTLCLSEVARAYPTLQKQHVVAPRTLVGSLGSGHETLRCSHLVIGWAL